MIYVRKYDEEWKKKMKISFIVFLLIITFASLLNGNLGLFCLSIVLFLFYFLFRMILPRDLKIGKKNDKKCSKEWKII